MPGSQVELESLEIALTSPPLCSAFFCAPPSLVEARLTSCPLSNSAERGQTPPMVPTRLLELDLTLPVRSHVQFLHQPVLPGMQCSDWPGSGVKGGVSSSQIAWMGGRDSPRKIWVLSSQHLGLKPGQAIVTDVSCRSSIPLLPPHSIDFP